MMKSLLLKEILLNTGGSIIQGSDSLVIKNVVTKSLRIKPGALLIHYWKNNINWRQIKLDNTNAVITENPDPFLKNTCKGVTIVKVDDVKKAYWAFVNYYRDLFDIPRIGVTGTCGKTTTTEMIKTILSDKYAVQGTKVGKNGLSFNLPYLLGINKNTGAAVIEMGVSYPGDLINTCKHFKPQIGVILNIGTYHLQHCKTADNYFRAKTRLITGMSHQGTLILNADDKKIKKINLARFKGNVVYFGFSDKAHYKAKNISYSDAGMKFILQHDGHSYPCFVPGFGIHNVYNALAAIAASVAAGIGIKSAVTNLTVFRPVGRHLQLYKGPNGCTIIDDTWNCTPPSMESALQVLTELDGARKKVAIFGYMPQLGKAGFEEYDRIGKKVARSETDFLITIGAEAERIGLKAVENGFPAQKTRNCKNGADLYEALTPYLDKNHLILFKFPYKYRLSKFASFKNFMAKMLQAPLPKKKHGTP